MAKLKVMQLWPASSFGRLRLAVFICVLGINFSLAFKLLTKDSNTPQVTTLIETGLPESPVAPKLSAIEPTSIRDGSAEGAPSIPFSPAELEVMKDPETLAVPLAFRKHYTKHIECVTGDPAQLSDDIIALLEIPPAAVEKINQAYSDLVSETAARDIAAMQISGETGSSALDVGEVDHTSVDAKFAQLGEAIGETIKDQETSQLLADAFNKFGKIRKTQRVPPGKYTITRKDYTRQNGERFGTVILTPSSGTKRRKVQILLSDPVASHIVSKAGL